MPAERISRRYEIVNALGEGGMGVVYRAYDRLTGETVALKYVQAPLEHDDEADVALKVALAQEFKMLASLRHPNIIGVLDYGFHDKQPFFTMELLEAGRTIVEAGRHNTESKQIDLILQLLQAMRYLHRRGILHRDLKPSNIMVVEDAVKVLDFGLAMTRDHANDEFGPTVGTLAYMAPEALSGGEISEATDLYSVGVIAYELLSGKLPFDASQPIALIYKIYNAVPDMSALEAHPEIIAVVERLLAKESLARFMEASHVIQAIADALQQPLPMETIATRESFLQAARLVGRDAELAQLTDALAQAQRGSGSAWLVGGESGVGKSRLVDELRVLAMVQGMIVLRCQAVSEGGSPYHVWRSSLRWLALIVEMEDTEAQELMALVPDIETLIGREVDSSAADAAKGKLVTVIERLFRRIPQPVLLILEDLQWADSESLAVLSRLNTLVEDLPLMIVGSYRNDEMPDLPQILPGMALLPLERLSEEGIAQLSAEMLGPVGEQAEVVDLLQRETEGNVFFLVEVVRALAEEAGQLDHIGLVTLPRNVFAGGVRLIIQRRLTRIPEEHRPMLMLAAVLGRELDGKLLRALMPDKSTLDRWLTNCANAAVLTVDEDEWRFTHDKLRLAVLDWISDEERAPLHRRVAEAIEAVYPNTPSQAAILAFHWGRAWDSFKEAHYSSVAGEHALKIGAFHEALRFLGRALELNLTGVPSQVARADELRRVYLRARIAEAHLGLGDYAAAESLYHKNLDVCTALNEEEAIADAYSALGDIDYAMAKFESAEDYYQRSLDLYQSAQQTRGIAKALNSLGNVAYELGDDHRAMKLYQESLSLNRKTGAQWGMAGSIAGKSAQADDSDDDLD